MKFVVGMLSTAELGKVCALEIEGDEVSIDEVKNEAEELTVEIAAIEVSAEGLTKEFNGTIETLDSTVETAEVIVDKV